MENFSIEKKGYNKEQVTNYIRKISSQFENANLEQRERIESLKRENKDLTLQLSEYQAKKDSINSALTQAIEKAKNIEYASKIRYALEGERIAIFEKKWTSYCKNAVQKVAPQVIAELNDFLSNIRRELKSMLSENLNLNSSPEVGFELSLKDKAV